MGFTLRFTLGTLLVLFCSWSNEAVHLNRLIRQISQNVGNHTSDKLQNIEPETTTQQNILVKGSDQDNRQPKTDSNSEHKIADNNINKLQNSEDSKTTTDEEEKKVREEIGRSIDIKKYTSKEFHSKNNVYKLPLSPDTEKYINPEYDFHHATTHKHSEEFSFYSQLTTPKSSIFDSKFREAVDSVDQKLEHIDESDEFSEESESTENINLEAFIDETNKNDSAANLHYVNYKNIISNNTGNKSSLHKDLVLEAGTNLNFQNFYNHTTFTDENNDGNNTNGKAQDKEKKVDISTLSNIIPAKSDLDNAESSTGKSVILTTKKSIVVTKPSSNKNLSHISILSNRIEKETIKAVNPVQTTEENEDQKEIIETVSDVGTSVNISKRPLIFVNMASTQAAVIPDQVENSTKHFQENKLANHSIKLETTADGFKNISTTTVSSIITTIKPATDISDSDEDDSIVSLHTTVLPLSKDTMISPTEFVAELNISTTEAPVTKQIEIETITSILTETSTTPWERVTNQPTLFQPTTLSTIKYENEPTTNSPEAPTIVQAISDEYETITPAPTYQADSTVASNREILKINLVTTTEVATDSAEATNTPVEVTTTLSEITTTSPVVTTTLQEVTTTLQEVTTTSPEITTTSPEITTTSPEITTTSPEITTSSEVIATTTEVLIAPTKINTFPTTTLQSNESDYFVTTESTVRTSKELEIKDNVVTESSFVAISGVQTKKITVEDGGTVISTTPIIDVETSTESVNYGTEDGKIGDYNITDFGIRNETILKPEYKSSGQNEPDAESENATNISIIFSESYEHNNDSDDNSGTVAAITISSIGAVCLILLAGLLIIMRKRQKRFNYGQRCTPVSLDDYSMDNVSVYNSVRRKGMVRSSKRSYGNPAFEDPVCISHPLNFPALGKFANNVEDIKAEFEDIPQITARMNELPEGCDTKNRYANVIPLPETRVFLSLIDGYPNSDYINANYVTGPKNIKGYYIACQAPLQNTVDDFWRMIWEQQSKVILMLTHLFENGVEKCVDYLPPSEVLDCHRLFGDFQVTLKKREVKDKYIISSLQLKNMVSNSWREVTHFWYLGWPEKGVPSEANSLIAFLIEARSYMKCSSLDTKEDTKNNLTNGVAKNEINPVVVHCSPGTGRTGVVIACDIAIREFEQTRLVDVPRIVYKIRRDRATAVQTKEQYAFIYKVINLYATKLTGGILDSF